MFLGYTLGVLAIISGGKIAIALLVMGVPILDVAWTIIRRLLAGKNPFKAADKKHLHHRLLDSGLSQKQTVFVFYFLAAVFGISGLFLQSQGKIIFLGGIVVLMFLLVIFLSFVVNKKKNKPTLLLHVCCAPCSAYIIKEILSKDFKVTIYFYNSNLSSEEEYDARLKWVRFIADLYQLDLIIEPYQHSNWLSRVKGREADPEKGARCLICYEDRLEKTALLVKEKNFNYFSTSLLVSPYKDREALLRISKQLAIKHQVNFLDEDFSSEGLYHKSQDLAKELGFYRQKFCGCEFSKR